VTTEDTLFSTQMRRLVKMHTLFTFLIHDAVLIFICFFLFLRLNKTVIHFLSNFILLIFFEYFTYMSYVSYPFRTWIGDTISALVFVIGLLNYIIYIRERKKVKP
jgi:hypothetical protein